ncbi:MAG: AI-2E family transporter, partial [Candidatus Poribacteria bacterium]|nr:AI-2E family transporter [Candidatus Poribacteria bacterium]
LAEYSKQKGVPVWLTFLGLIIVAVGLLSLVGSFITVDNFNLAGAIPRYQERISEGSGPMLELASKLGFGLESISKDDIGKLAGRGARAGLGAIRTIFSETLLALILLMFIVQSRSGLFAAVERKYGTDEVLRLQDTIKKIEGDIIAYFGTKALMSLGTALLTLPVLLLFGAKFISISMLLIFMLNFIPIVGSMVAVLVVVILYVVPFGLSAQVGWLFLALMAVQIFFGNILEPKIAGERLNMSPILILVSLYVWGWIWGVIGMFLSVPLTIMILIVVRHMGSMRTPDSDAATQL